jgi:hypothetical protein
MALQTPIVHDADADRRWREWQARGAEGDRRTVTRMRTLMLVIAAGLAAWFALQLV